MADQNFNNTSVLGEGILGRMILGYNGKNVAFTEASVSPDSVNTNGEYKIAIKIRDFNNTSVLGDMILGQGILGYSRKQS